MKEKNIINHLDIGALGTPLTWIGKYLGHLNGEQ